MRRLLGGSAPQEHDRRRSHSILHHLIDTSPDCITLTEMASGRYELVNKSFERVTGWTMADVAGRTSAEVGIWIDVQDRDRIVDAVRDHGIAEELPARIRAKSGDVVSMRISAARFTLDGRDYLVLNGRDVTQVERERREQEAQRREIERTLAAARDAAEAASRAKSVFLANTSHEIRTPLNALLGLARLAMESGLEEEHRQRYLEQIFESAHSLCAIMSDILDLSKIEAGRFSLESVPFGLRDTLHSVHDAYRALAEARGLRLALTVDTDVPATVLGDPVRVRQILTNFITNAIKFTERGRVRIHASVSGPERVRLAVTDTGPGIDEATQTRLFRPFSQADDSTTRRYGGTGLGLSICRELAHLMGGEVGVLSRAGAGSTFWAELPLHETERPEAVPGHLDVLADRLCGARVLMVEDNAVNMMIAVAMLERWGVEVTQASDGAMALDAVEAAAHQGRLFDVVLMDVHMPRMSGHEAARLLRARFDARRLPIIALTAAALVSEREQAIAAGMNEFLTKPIDAQKLKEALARAISLHDGA